MKWLFPLGLLIAFEGLADIASKEWAIGRGFWFGVLAISLYVIANVFWLFSLRSGAGLARGAILFSIGSALLAIIIGLIFYREHVSGIQIAGMVIGVIGVALMLWE